MKKTTDADGKKPKEGQQPLLDVERPNAGERVEEPRGGPPWKARTKLGYDLDVTISALQKAIRRGREREGLFWAHELYTSGFHQYFWRRMLIIAHEECASDPMAAIFVGVAMQNAMYASQNSKGRIEGLIEAHAVLYLARAVKSREACDAAMAMNRAKEHGFRIEPHHSSLDKHTARGRGLGDKRAHFGNVGRVVAGKRGRNDYEALNWSAVQPYHPRPDEPDGEADVEIPKVAKDER